MGADKAVENQEVPEIQKFGTFIGVFTPSVLTILGVMMYLRFGWVLGNLGLPLALLTILLASSITFITGLSASAIATNMRVGAGGEYYMISRSLGPELGGAIGIPLFLCRILSLTLYAFGLAESITYFWPATWGAPPLQMLAAGIIVVVTAIAGRSAAASLKLQLPIMIAVGISLVALIIGVLSGGLVSPEMTPHYERSAPAGFWYVFAVFFPAVTGFSSGIGMSGDLENPKRSIPRGTIFAVITSTLIYLLILGLLSVTSKVTPEELSTLDPNAPPIWTRVALFGFWLVYPGLWGAILSSAFGSALGGPRVLQALANDGLAPKFLSKTSKTGQPTIATWISGAIALAAVLLGNLNEVGRIVSIFFLTLYVTINVAAATESLVGDPSYRPTVRIHWFISLLGSIGAVVVMFLISPIACGIAIALEILLYTYLRHKLLKSNWGDVRAGLWTAIARFSLLKLQKLDRQARNWRPHILLFTSNPERRVDMLRLANWFNQKRGIITVCKLIEGNLQSTEYDIAGQEKAMEVTFESEGLIAFSEVDVVPDFETGVINIAQSNGFAGLQSNTIMLGWPNSPERIEQQIRMMRATSQIGLSTLIVKTPLKMIPYRRKRIDVWWRGKRQNGDLMLLLAHLLNVNQDWQKATVSVRTIVDSEAQREEMQEKLSRLIEEARIEAEADVIVRPEAQTFREVMHESSVDADVIFLGLIVPKNPEEDTLYAAGVEQIISGFKGTTILVHNSGAFAGELIE